MSELTDSDCSGLKASWKWQSCCTGVGKIILVGNSTKLIRYSESVQQASGYRSVHHTPYYLISDSVIRDVTYQLDDGLSRELSTSRQNRVV